MKRTCLKKNTTCPDLSGNTDDQNSCEFHPVEISFKEGRYDPKDNQYVKNFVRMKKYILAIITLAFLNFGGYSQDNPQQTSENKGNSFKIIFENGFLIGNPDLQYPMPFSSHLSFEKNYKNLYLGIGSGAEVIGRTHIPFFASIKYVPFKTKPLYIYGKGGYNVCLSNEYKQEDDINYNYYPYYTTEYKYFGGVMAEAGFGIILKMKNWDSSISIGYRYQKTKYETTYNKSERMYENIYNRLALRFGFWF